MFRFGTLLREWPLPLDGLLLAMRLSLTATVFGLAVGTVSAAASVCGGKVLRGAVRGYVELRVRSSPLADA